MRLKLSIKPQSTTSNGSTQKERKCGRRLGVISPVILPNQNIEIFGRLVKKSLEDEETIISALQKNKLLYKILKDKYLQTCVDCMYIKNFNKNDILMKEGDFGEQFFISEKGTFEISSNGNIIEVFNDNRVFGEIAFLHNCKRELKVKALEEGSVWVLDCCLLKHLIINAEKELQDELVTMLTKVPTFSILDRDKLYLIANLLKIEEYNEYIEVIEEDTVDDTMYILLSGKAVVKTKKSNRVEIVERGAFFSDKALITKYSHTCTVITETKCVFGLLCRKKFLNNFRDYDHMVHVKRFVKKNSVMEFTHDLKNFTILRTLGIGGFGRVELVQHSENPEMVFALKYIKKHEINTECLRKQIYNEKHMQMLCDNPFIVHLYRTYKDAKYIYFLLDPCLGGDLWSLLRKQKNSYFEEDAAKFYSGCILEALGYLHENDIVYRDLKPENIMVDSNGYVKLTDFGFAKKLTHEQKSRTFVGTAEYVAPEIIKGKGHGKAVDYWALGILIFELLVGKTPFLETYDNKSLGANDLKTYQKILKGIDSAYFPYHVPPKARNIIKKLCKPIPDERLGCLKDGIKDVQIHPWYSRFNWDQLRSLQMSPPLTICLSGITDTSYFSKYRDDAVLPPDDFSTWDEQF